MENVLVLNTINSLTKLKSVALIALTISPLIWVIDKLTEWHVTNGAYATLVLGALIMDHILGSVYHAFFKRDFSIKKNLAGLMLKVLVIVTVGYLFEGLNELMAAAPMLKDYTVMTLRLMVFLYPAGSAFTNSYELTNKKFPPMGFMEQLKKFSKYDGKQS